MSHYLDPKCAAASYRPRSGAMSPGLLRAREPYRIRNAMTGLALGAFAVGIWAYSISAVKQDVFDDIDEEARALQSSNNRPASRDQLAIGPTSSTAPDQAYETGAVPLQGTHSTATSPPPPPPRRGVLQHLDSRFPNLLDPVTKTLVSGAPPIDNLGTISGSKTK